MFSLRNAVEAYRNFRMYRRYDHPALFFFIEAGFGLTKLVLLTAVCYGGFVMVQGQLDSWSKPIVAHPPETAGSRIASRALVETPIPATFTPRMGSVKVISQLDPTATERIIPMAVISKAERQLITTNPVDTHREIGLLLANMAVKLPGPVTPDSAPGQQPSAPVVRYRPKLQWTNVRSEPRVNSDIITSLDTTDSVQIVLQKGDWVKVLAGKNRTGYVRASLLEAVPAERLDATQF